MFYGGLISMAMFAFITHSYQNMLKTGIFLINLNMVGKKIKWKKVTA